MNHLNSVLIEGTLIAPPDFSKSKDGLAMCTFTLASTRYVKQGTKVVCEVCSFAVETSGMMAERVNDIGYEGQGIRVVGRLKQESRKVRGGKMQAHVVIVAEHVEFRPEAVSEEEPEDVVAA
jgi:single-strand DNA-binding protein